MNTNQLEQLIVVADVGSMHKAADRLFITHQALSAAIRNLEKEFGTELIVRSAKGVTLSDAGKRVYDMAREVLSMIEKTKADVEPAKLNPTLNLRVVVAVNTTRSPVIVVLRRFSESNPKCSLSINSMTPTNALVRIKEKRADFAVVALLRDQISELPSEVRVINRYSQRLFAVMRAEHQLAKRKTLTFDQLFKYPMVFYHPDFEESDEAAVRALWGTDATPLIALETDDLMFFNSSVIAGKGYGIVSESMLRSPMLESKLEFSELVAIPIKMAVEVPVCTLCRSDIDPQRYDLILSLDSIIASDLNLKRIDAPAQAE